MILTSCDDVEELVAFLKRDYANNLYFFTYLHEIIGGDPEVSVLVGRERGSIVLAALITPVHFCVAVLDESYAEMAAQHFSAIESIHVLGKAGPINKILAIIKTPVRKKEEYTLCRLNPALTAKLDNGITQKASLEDLADLISFYRANDMLLNCETRLESILSWGTIYLIRMDGRIVSCALTTTETEDAAMLGALFTEPGYRRRGYGSSCSQSLCQEMTRKNKEVYLFYKSSDLLLKDMYEGIGFEFADSWVLATRSDI